MAWRPTQYLLKGELDNTTAGKVTGWMKFAGLKNKVTFELQGNFHRDIRSAKIRLLGYARAADADAAEARQYMDTFATRQTGKVGNITAGLPPIDYSSTPYVEWYSEENGRVVIELGREQLLVIGKPIPACESDPVSRAEQSRNMAEFVAGISSNLGAPAVVVRQEPMVSDPVLLMFDFFAPRANFRAACSQPTCGAWVAGEARAVFTHWIVVDGHVVGEAHSVRTERVGMSFA